MRVGIAKEESRLIKGKTESPYRGRTTELGQDSLADHGLNQENQERRCEDRPDKEQLASRSIPTSGISSVEIHHAAASDSEARSESELRAKIGTERSK